MGEAFVAEWESRGYKVDQNINMGKVDHADYNEDDEKCTPSERSLGTCITNAKRVADQLLKDGTTAVTVLTTVSHDANTILEELSKNGMTGAGWTYLGADGVTS